jgi:hypothetical protein
MRTAALPERGKKCKSNMVQTYSKKIWYNYGESITKFPEQFLLPRQPIRPSIIFSSSAPCGHLGLRFSDPAKGPVESFLVKETYE